MTAGWCIVSTGLQGIIKRMPKLQLSGLDIAHDIIPKGIPSLRISQHSPGMQTHTPPSSYAVSSFKHSTACILHECSHHLKSRSGNHFKTCHTRNFIPTIAKHAHSFPSRSAIHSAISVRESPSNTIRRKTSSSYLITVTIQIEGRLLYGNENLKLDSLLADTPHIVAILKSP